MKEAKLLQQINNVTVFVAVGGRLAAAGRRRLFMLKAEVQHNVPSSTAAYVCD